jgi:Tfp pilus assembly protein PilZ
LASNKQPDWILAEFPTSDQLDLAIRDREKRLLFYPAIGKMQKLDLVDLQVTVEDSNILFPMTAKVVFVRQRPNGKDKPRGVGLQIIDEDARRFDRLCAFVDGVWQPGVRRAHRRYPADFKAKYYFPSKYQPAKAANLSERGVFLRCDGPLPEVGQGLFVSLQTSRLGRPIELESQVRWIDPVESRRGMGLLCQGPDKSMQKLLSLVKKITQEAKA